MTAKRSQKRPKFAVPHADARPLRVFLAHANADKEIVNEFFRLLILDGFEPWLDIMNLVGGQQWQSEIEKAVRASQAVAVFLSRNSVDHRGFVQKEITLALDAAGLQPEGAIFILPVRLDDASVPGRFEHLHWIEARDEARLIGAKYVGLQRALIRRAGQLSVSRNAYAPRVLQVPYVTKVMQARHAIDCYSGRVPRESVLIRSSGPYLVRGENPNGETYAGTATFDMRGRRIMLKAAIAGQVISYAGEIYGDTMRFTGAHRVDYRYRPDANIWIGRWNDECVEELIPASPFAGTV